ncbi:MAG: aminodeoxychorismate/anthranilate synthase component II [Blastocatellia bacterium]|nr:aminodeoxychorismate/anthranilate synthase component II [Blastocatellia bacterium]
MSILLLDNYDSFTYNLFQMVQALTEEPVEVFRNDALDFAEVLSRRPSRILLSPGPGHPGIDTDFGVCREVITRYEEIRCPLLGVCLGHQGIIHFFGGNVVRAPEIVHGKSSVVTVTEASRLFENLPTSFEAMRYHSLVAEEATIPAEFLVTARETRSNLVMAVEHRRHPIFGVQFHPESIGTPDGSAILGNFLKVQGSGFRVQGSGSFE